MKFSQKYPLGKTAFDSLLRRPKEVLPCMWCESLTDWYEDSFKEWCTGAVCSEECHTLLRKRYFGEKST